MVVIVEGQIKGSFTGWRQGATFVLDQGREKKWRQVDLTFHLRTMFRPKAKLIRDGSTFYLEVEGMGDMVEVKRG